MPSKKKKKTAPKKKKIAPKKKPVAKKKKAPAKAKPKAKAQAKPKAKAQAKPKAAAPKAKAAAPQVKAAAGWSTFPPVLASLEKWVNGGRAGEIDFEMYQSFNEQYKPSDWTRNAKTDEELFTFGMDRSGGQVAIWRNDAAKELDALPIVFMGSEGEIKPFATTLPKFLFLLASGLGPAEAFFGGEANPNDEMLDWVRGEYPSANSESGQGNPRRGGLGARSLRRAPHVAVPAELIQRTSAHFPSVHAAVRPVSGLHDSSQAAHASPRTPAHRATRATSCSSRARCAGSTRSSRAASSRRSPRRVRTSRRRRSRASRECRARARRSDDRARTCEARRASRRSSRRGVRPLSPNAGVREFPHHVLKSGARVGLRAVSLDPFGRLERAFRHRHVRVRSASNTALEDAVGCGGSVTRGSGSRAHATNAITPIRTKRVTRSMRACFSRSSGAPRDGYCDRAGPRGDFMSRVFSFVFKALTWALMIATPLLGVWVASSLAAYANARVSWVVAVGGALVSRAPARVGRSLRVAAARARRDARAHPHVRRSV